MLIRGKLLLQNCTLRPLSTLGSAFHQTASDIRVKIDEYKHKEDYNTALTRHAELSTALSKSELWDNATEAAQLNQEFSSLSASIDFIKEVEDVYHETLELHQLGEAENDPELLKDCEDTLEELHDRLKSRKMERILSSEEDQSSCYVEIVAGVGGLDAFDWTRMLANMYVKWAKVVGYSSKVTDEQVDEDTASNDCGYRRVTIRLDGHRAYGYMKAEAGTHRLVRRSPFDPTDKRHTSFAQVRVYPAPKTEGASSAKSYQVHQSDLRIDTYKSRGAGGQSVNTTDSAVRITHIPTGTVVTCQNERSQHMNKASALKVLQAKLWRLDLQRREEEKLNSKIGLGDNSWGTQIRSLVLHPYLMVKDHRSGWETTDVEGILEGTELLTEAIEAYLIYHDNLS